MEKFLTVICFSICIAFFQQECNALVSKWTNAVPACIKNLNNMMTETTSVEACQQLCEQQENFRCLSIDFAANSGQCFLSRYNRNSVPSTEDFYQPCYNEGWVYSERMDLDFPWSEVVLGCIKKHNELERTASSMAECQLLCERETSFPCMSVDFREEEEECLLSRYNRESVRPLSDYKQPCYLERYQYSERTDRKYFWTETAAACIRGNNNERHEGIESLEDCQDLCLQETSFACLSIDYFPNGTAKTCLLSSFNRNSVTPSDFTQPCYEDGGFYTERVDVGQWTPVLEDSCISGFNEWSDSNVEDLESCRILCSQRPNCCSFDYQSDTKDCLLTSKTRATVSDSDFVSPCSGYSFSERTDVRCVTS